MLDIQTHVPLAPFTTLKVGGSAEYFVSVTNEDELLEAVAFARERSLPLTVLGGGSNMLVSDEGVHGLVVRMLLRGRTANIERDTVLFSVAAGENFDEVIAYSVENGWWGLENLSHIPGTVGATPVQNVGAYGVEIQDVVQSVRVYNTEENQFQILAADACAFGYRDSLFKREEGKGLIITEVTYALSPNPNRQLSYRDLASFFEGIAEPSQQEIREAVMKIRAGKFPDWHSVGTAGSFFKNPIIATEAAAALQKRYPDLPVYPVNDHESKVSLGWILDKVLHLRGYAAGNVALYKDQALVLVANEQATAREIETFANAVVEKIHDATGITVAWEVRKVQ